MKSQLQLYKCCILSDYINLALEVLMPREINGFYNFKISDEGLVIVICFNTLLWGLYVLHTSVISYEFHTALMQTVQPWNE